VHDSKRLRKVEIRKVETGKVEIVRVETLENDGYDMQRIEHIE